jgi:hypothetical protein
VTTDGTPWSRGHNQQNQPINIGTPSLAYDNNGNLTQDGTTSPKSVSSYDDWKRLGNVYRTNQ